MKKNDTFGLSKYLIQMNKIPTTVEAQIRTRARNLPIYKCYINKDWEKAKKAIVLITRKHTNGNITMGQFFVDLNLRGVKDCLYMFNESPLRMDELLKQYLGIHEECEYDLAHNIIYAAFEFAGEYGFEPHKNFKTAQYILDEDTENIPLIEIPLGVNGIPVLEIPFGANCQREITILKKKAGNSFHVVYLNKNGQPENVARTYSEVFDEAIETGFDEFIKKHSGTKSFRVNQVIIDLMYMDKVYTEEEKKQIEDEYFTIINDTRLPEDDLQFETDYEKELDRSIRYFEEEKTDKALTEFHKVIGKYPDDPLLWNVLLYNLSLVSDNVDEITVKDAYSRFPDHPLIKAWYAEWLAQEERHEEVFALFHQIPALDALTSENIHIGYISLPSFCFAYAMAWLNKENVLRAEPYYQIIVRMGLDYRLGEYIQKMMLGLKRKKINEMIEAGMFGSDDQPDDK